ncbi:hypothetical protein ACGFNU_22705 [Spirillospora sp. NPDC048911]|uniref:hypothetical protein n=1 Tax=Spirillospora sp. NPDC048911 TaxID=3364527 RepID=UPI00371EBE08
MASPPVPQPQARLVALDPFGAGQEPVSHVALEDRLDQLAAEVPDEPQVSGLRSRKISSCSRVNGSALSAWRVEDAGAISLVGSFNE